MDELTRIGDRMQSEASRVAEWVSLQVEQGLDVPYEVEMGAAGLRAAVEDWTAARRPMCREKSP